MRIWKLCVLVMGGMGVMMSCNLVVPAFAEDPLVIADSVFNKADEAMARAEKARQVYDRVKNMGKPAEEVRKAEEQFKQAAGEAKVANAKLDEARVDAIAEAAGVSPSKVAEMRSSGMGWGNIAGELGVHPSIVSKGAKKSKFRKKGTSGDDAQGDDTKGKENKSSVKSENSKGKPEKAPKGKKK